MNSHSAAANDFLLSLRLGIIDRKEIIQWADEIIGSEPFDEAIANICLATFGNDKQLLSLIRAVAGKENSWGGVKKTLGRMHQALLTEPGRPGEFTGLLRELAFRNYDSLPEDLEFMLKANEDYHCAKEGLWGSVEEVRADLMENLARFKTAT